MIVRIVKLNFKQAFLPQAQEILEVHGPKVRAREGCTHLQILQDKHDPRTYFTISHWTSEEALNAYRNSEVFREFWPSIKVGFETPAQAWSCK